jgi:diadenosine tetraphosphatase ApaH/serine/threonine PP2A family protein phosphatase
MEEGFQYIINPGAVGQPRDGNPMASFGIYDTKKRHVETRRVTYPIEKVQEKMKSASLPDYLIVRLERGH